MRTETHHNIYDFPDFQFLSDNCALTEYNLGLKYFNIEDAGKVLVRGVKDQGDIKGTSFLEDAYQLDISI